MATKSSDLLDRIPSLQELLEKPPLRALADRWNRSVVAAGAKSFLDELRSDLQRRAADLQFPSLRELAERAARYVVRLQQPTYRPAINATGRLVDPGWAGCPVADEALERVVVLGRGFVTAGSDRAKLPRSCDDATGLLTRISGAEAATVVHSYAGAIWLTLSAIAAEKEIIAARAELGDVEPNLSLSDLAKSAAVTLHEVGTANRAGVSDYEAAIRETTSAILSHVPDGYRVAGETTAAELDELIALARDREVTLVHAIGAAPLLSGLPGIGDEVRSAAACVDAGCHVVILRGNGFVGGPPCGIILGSRQWLRRIESHPTFPAWRAAPTVTASLGATLELYDDPNQLPQSVPVFRLLNAPVENLRQRAERLAPQLAQSPLVASAEPMATHNPLGIACSSHDQRPSIGIALAAAETDVAALDQRLRSGPVPIVGRCEDDRLVLDLRTVFPWQDQILVEMLAGEGADCRTESASNAADA